MQTENQEISQNNSEMDLTESQKKKRALKIMADIRDVFNKSWDPIPCSPEDEYDSYIGGVYRLLARGTDIEELARHMAQIEDKWLGESASIKQLIPLAEKLIEINVRLNPNDKT